MTIAVWLAGMLVAATLIARRPTSQIRGLAWAEPIVLTAPEDGALSNFELELHDSVSAGEVIAHVGPELLTARRQVLSAEVKALSEVEFAERQGRARLFERDREAAVLELDRLVARVDEGRARAHTLYEQLAVDERLFDEGVIPREKVLAVEREIHVLEARLTAEQKHLETARSGVREASARATAAPGSNLWQVTVARRELREVDTRIDQLVLRSAIGGQITEIYRYPGEWLRAGERIARVTPVAATEVHAWIDGHARPDTDLKSATARIRTSDSREVRGVVESVGAERLQLPQSLWSRSDAPEWGYLIRIKITDGALAPGEPVRIGLRP